MKRVASLLLENFQSHRYTEISFVSGMNVFVGPSDSGKSAILRALRWVLFNQPRGSEYIRVGADHCRVTLTMNDGVKIIRERSSSTNRYILINPEGEKQIFEGFGSGVPQEILDSHGMHPLKLDQDWELPIQFGSQLEAPFLLSETGSIKAKTIGRVSGAHLIDLALNQAVSDRRALTAKIKNAEEQAQQLQQDLESYKELDQMKEKLERAHQLFQGAEDLLQQMNRLKKLREELLLCRQRQGEVKSKLEQLSSLPLVEGLVSNLEYLELRSSLLNAKRLSWLHNQRERRICLEVIERTAHLPKVAHLISQAEEAKKELSEWSVLHKRLQHLRREIRTLQHWLEKTEQMPAAGFYLEEIVQLQTRLQKIKPQAVRWQRIVKEKEVCEELLNRTQRVPKAFSQVFALEMAMDRYKELVRYQEQLADKRRRMQIGTAFLQQKEREIREQIHKLTCLFEEVGQCPTCGSVIDQEILKRITKEYQGGEDDAAAGREN